MNSSRIFLFLCFVLLFSCEKNIDWNVYGGSYKRTQFVNSEKLNLNNISNLKKVWQYSTADNDNFSQIQTNPLIINDKFYGVSPKLKLFSLEAKSGSEIWVFDPFNSDYNFFDNDDSRVNVCRGITYFKDNSKQAFIFYAVGSKLFKVNIKNGIADSSFGNNGFVDLHIGLGTNSSSLFVTMTSPGVIYKNLIIVGSSVSEGNPAAKGNIRAFDANTGDLKWSFNTIPEIGEDGHETYSDPDAYKRLGGANAWSGLTLDEERGILYAPTGSVSYDFYGGDRVGDNLFANSIIALSAETGNKIWHFQTVHHDVWDRDLPAPPILFDYSMNDSIIPSLAQVTKSGYIYLLNRITGKPLYKIIERPVPSKSNLEGEVLSKTQPIPSFPDPFSRQSLTKNDINSFVIERERDSLIKIFTSLLKDDIFSPPSEEGTLIFPGFDGGAEWGGPALDPINNKLFINSNEMPWILTMKKVSNTDSQGMNIYNKQCLMCHGIDYKGSGENPSILDLSSKYNFDELRSLVINGKGLMPGFKFLDDQKIEKIVDYIMNLKDGDKTNILAINEEVFYTSTGYNKFITNDGYPAINPPWGTLNSINLNTGKLDWKIPLGQTDIGIENNIITGTENYGGPIVTKSGIIIIAATADNKIRAFNSKNGELLWEEILPFSGFATPSYFEIEGNPYIAIASGGGKLGTKSGDKYVVFSITK